MTDLRGVPGKELQAEIDRRIRKAQQEAGQPFPVEVWIDSKSIHSEAGARRVELRDTDGTVWKSWDLRAFETLTITGLLTELRLTA